MIEVHYEELTESSAFCLMSLAGKCYSRVGEDANVNGYEFPMWNNETINHAEHTVFLDKEIEEDPDSEYVLTFVPSRGSGVEEFVIHDGGISYMSDMMRFFSGYLKGDTDIKCKASDLTETLLHAYVAQYMRSDMEMSPIKTESQCVTFMTETFKLNPSYIHPIFTSSDVPYMISITFADKSTLNIDF